MRCSVKGRGFAAVGCLVALALVFLIVVGTVLYLGVKWQVLKAAPRVQTASFAGEHTAALAVLDVDQIEAVLARALAQESGYPYSPFRFFLPYECAVMVDIDRRNRTRQFKGVASMRRLGPLAFAFFSTFFDDPELFGPEGAHMGTAPEVTIEKGVLVVSLDNEIAEESLALVYDLWPETAPGGLPFAGGHLLEVHVDNRNGQGLLALEGLGALIEDAPDGVVPRERQNIFDADELSGIFYRVQTARVTADILGNDRMEILVDMDCPDELAARAMEFALLTVRDMVFKSLLEIGVVLEGDPVLDGTQVRAELTLSGVERAIAEGLRRIENLAEEADG